MITRRSGYFYLFLMMAFVGLIFRIFSLMTGENAALAQKVMGSRGVTLTLYNTKGLIYDEALIPLAGNQPCNYLLVDPRNFKSENIEALASLSGKKPEFLREKLKKETPFVLKCNEKNSKMEGIEIFEGVSRYSGVSSHLLGYLDGEGQVGLSGVEKEFNSFLNLFSSSVSIKYEADALNGIIAERKIEKSEDESTKNGVILTLNHDLCRILETSMDQHIEKGAAIIMDCKKGEIKAICSRPDYDEESIADYLNSENGELMNRALSSQAVGSVFKIVLAACAFEGGMEDFEYQCDGGIIISDQTIACHNHSGHGEIGLKEAFSNSCNSYFIALGQLLGERAIHDMAARFGFGEKIELMGSISSASGNLPTASGGLALANLSIGQGDLLASPLQVARMTSVVANGGILLDPILYKGLYLDGSLKIVEYSKAGKQIISEECADFLRECCIEAVENGTGTAAKPSFGTAGGKTSSAQTGIIKDGKEQLNVYFSGFYPAEDPQYVITVFAEDGISGGKTCGPVFREVCNYIGEKILTP